MTRRFKLYKIIEKQDKKWRVKKMNKILNSKYGLLIFSLISGIAYFILIMMLISQMNYSYLLGIFFFPAVVCGIALCLYKSIRNLQNLQEWGKIRLLILLHILVIALSIAFFAVSIISKFVL